MPGKGSFLGLAFCSRRKHNRHRNIVAPDGKREDLEYSVSFGYHSRAPDGKSFRVMRFSRYEADELVKEWRMPASGSGPTKGRFWALAGFLVAGLWALYAAWTFPTPLRAQAMVWTLINASCPITFASFHFRCGIKLYWVLRRPAARWWVVGR